MAGLNGGDETGTHFKAGHRFGIFRWLVSSLVVRLVFVLVVFAAVPFFLYQQLREADAEKRNLLLESSQREGALIAAALRSRLQAAESGIPNDLNEYLSSLVGDDTGVKLLLSPGEGAARDFYYVAAAPAVPTSALEYERAELINSGILSRLAETCSGNMPIALRVPRDPSPPNAESGRADQQGASVAIDGVESGLDGAVPAVDDAREVDVNVEILTSITPIRSPQGCWALITSHSTDSYLETSIGQPYWMTPEVRMAGAIYLAMALLVTAIFAAMIRNLRRFGRIAHEIQRSDAGAGRSSSADNGAGSNPSFVAQNTIPELHDVAGEFDRLVERLHDSANSIRRAAEDNAHAFKTPIGIIRQSLEPLRRIADDNARAMRSVELVDQAVARLDSLVTLARQVDQSSADTVEPQRERLNLSQLLSMMVEGFTALEGRHAVRFSFTIAESLHVLGNEEMLETVIENIVDNAVSFSPRGGRIDVTLQRDGRTAILTVTDAGPGVDPEKLQRIFDRYYSDRPPPEEANRSATPDQGRSNGETGNHFGIGLWIVRRYVEALGGRVSARNVPGRGLRVSVRLELVN